MRSPDTVTVPLIGGGRAVPAEATRGAYARHHRLDWRRPVSAVVAWARLAARPKRIAAALLGVLQPTTP